MSDYVDGMEDEIEQMAHNYNVMLLKCDIEGGEISYHVTHRLK